MKKYISYNLFVFVLILSSCSKEDYAPADELVLPKKIRTISQDSPSRNFVTDIVYDGNKIVSISNINEKTEYIYKDNQIVKEIRYNYGYDQEKSEKVFTYENDRLKTVKAVVCGEERRYVYFYNADNTVNIETYIVDKGTAKELKSTESEVLTFADGNLVKSVYKLGSNDAVTTTRYNYDINNNAFKNVLGLNLLFDLAKFDSELNISCSNNIKRYNSSSTQRPLSDFEFEPDFRAMEYEYNKKGYPVKKTTYDEAGYIIDIIQYTY